VITKPASRCLLALAAFAALAACGGSSNSKAPSTTPGVTPPSGDPPATGEASCQRAVDALFAVVAAQEAPDLRALSAKVFVHRCEEDRWSAELRTCMVGVKAPEDADRCEAMMTPEQQKELRAELAKELDAAGVPAETQSGKSQPAKNAAPKAMDATPKADSPKKPAKESKSKAKAKGGADPCEGGE
jgi:hypothetical protein